MTGEQKQRIQDMRLQGTAYSRIADLLGLSANTVKSFCRRNNLTACDASKETENEENKDFCKQCGKKLKQIPKAKPKSFCCDKCRFDWWNTHRDEKKPNEEADKSVCLYCGKTYASHGNKKRKYCGHDCYIADRFRKAACV